MSTSFSEEGERHEDGGNLDHEILSEYLAEYKPEPRAFKEIGRASCRERVSSPV